MSNRARGRLSWQIMLGGGVFLFFVFIAVIAPWAAPYNVAKQDLMNTLAPPHSPGHLLGTDDLGRDMLSRLMGGARVSLFTGIVTALLSISIGVPLGLISGFYGGRVDLVLGRIFDTFLGIPSLLMALGLASVFGPSLKVVVIALGAVWWASYARIVRSEALSLSRAQFVEAAQAMGCSDYRILTKYLLPNVVPIVMALAPLTIASGILVEASLSFLGVGTKPPTPTWGGMLAVGRNYVRSAWWLSTLPGLAIVITILSLNLLGDGLRDRFDPKLQR